MVDKLVKFTKLRKEYYELESTQTVSEIGHEEILASHPRNVEQFTHFHHINKIPGNTNFDFLCYPF